MCRVVCCQRCRDVYHDASARVLLSGEARKHGPEGACTDLRAVLIEFDSPAHTLELILIWDFVPGSGAFPFHALIHVLNGPLFAGFGVVSLRQAFSRLFDEETAR